MSSWSLATSASSFITSSSFFCSSLNLSPRMLASELGVRAVQRVHLALDLVEQARVLAALVLGEQVGEPLLVRGDLVGHVEQTLEPLAVEPVGEHDRVVLELADHPAIERGERRPGRRLA